MNKKQLRQRIINNMPVILDLLARDVLPDSLGGNQDPRPDIISGIIVVAKLKATPRFEARRTLDRVAADVRQLELSIAKLPPIIGSMVKVEVTGLDVAAIHVEKQTGRTEANRKLLAAAVAFDLFADHGSVRPSLYPDGPYIGLAGLLYFVATGRKANLRKSCAQHLDDLEQESGINFRAHRRGRSASSSTRKEDPRIKKWPPLEAVVDEIIARCS